ncbi:MAG: formate dehydrogenase accessory sulfurtransferase FdhD [Candidatus Helarchaeota archaeon]|nr:formate dehydrogenase accessory sulfurtransferase FdhD [Candidatus Helarchaeota archaeon]
MKESILKPITRFSKGEFHKIKDEIAVETIIRIWVNENSITSVLCSPTLEKELVVGYLFTTGIINSFEEVEDIRDEGHEYKVTLNSKIDLDSRLKNSQFINRIISTGCGPPEYWLTVRTGKGLPKIESKIQVSMDDILKAVKDLNENSNIFRRTGATHAAGLYNASINRIIVAEDVGRHNAIDKVIGYAIIQGEKSFDDKILVSTGRLTADIVFKSAKCRIPIVASMAAATDSGISTAKVTNTTLLGFVRGKKKANIYTNPFRIIPNK